MDGDSIPQKGRNRVCTLEQRVLCLWTDRTSTCLLWIQGYTADRSGCRHCVWASRQREEHSCGCCLQSSRTSFTEGEGNWEGDILSPPPFAYLQPHFKLFLPLSSTSLAGPADQEEGVMIWVDCPKNEAHMGEGQEIVLGQHSGPSLQRRPVSSESFPHSPAPHTLNPAHRPPLPRCPAPASVQTAAGQWRQSCRPPLPGPRAAGRWFCY